MLFISDFLVLSAIICQKFADFYTVQRTEKDIIFTMHEIFNATKVSLFLLGFNKFLMPFILDWYMKTLHIELCLNYCSLRIITHEI